MLDPDPYSDQINADPQPSTKLFFLEIKAYRSARPLKEPEPFLVAAYGVKELAPATAAPELYRTGTI
jgi:hypothetical protein